MSDSGRTRDPQDPLEKYRQALRGQHSTGVGSTEVAWERSEPEEPPAAQPPPTDDALALDEPLPADEPLELGEPLLADEPLELADPLPAEEPLELGEPHAVADEPLELGEPLPTDKPRSAADWLGLGEELGEEDPLGLHDSAAPEALPRAASDDVQAGATGDDELPDELQDTLARYQKAMSRLRAGRGAEAAGSPAALRSDPGGPPEDSDPGTGNELLDKYLKAVDQRKSERYGRDTGARAPTVARETLNQFRKRRAGSPEPAIADELPADELPADEFGAEDPAHESPAKIRAAPRARRRVRPAPRTASGWGVRAVTFAVLLFSALPVQWLVYRHLGTAFALADLGAGLSALLPAALILLLARPGSGKSRLVMVFGSAAVGLIGSAGFAYGLSLLQSQLPQGASLLFGLLLTLGLFTAVWGPLFLILVPILSRMSPAARGST